MSKSETNLPGNWRRAGLGRGYFYLIALLTCLSAVTFFFRNFFYSHFDLIAGNLGDNRFLIVILEHWLAVLHNQASFRSPNFFWPEHNVLGYSDSLFLLAVPYVAVRSVGFDNYIAFEATLICFKILGFFSMLWLLRSFVRLTRLVALIGAALFTFSNLYFISAGHGHLMTVAFVPLLICLICTAWSEYILGRRILAFAYSTLFGTLLALVFFTSFYIGWFALLAAGVFVVAMIVGSVLRDRSVTPATVWAKAAAQRTPLLAAAALSFAVAMIPFFLTYLPTLKSTGGRSFHETLLYSPVPLDLINIGRENWIWGRPLDSLMVRLGHPAMTVGEVQRGWPPLSLSLLAAVMLFGFSTKQKGRESVEGQPRNLFLAAMLGVSFVFGWLLTLNFGGRSLWMLVFEFVPGGSAIRVPPRFNQVLNVFLVIAVCILLEEMNRQRSKIGHVMFWASSAFLLAEQFNAKPNHLFRRSEENAMLGRVNRVPFTCASFFLTHPADLLRPFFAFQIDGMLVARMTGIPTENGYSGWFPVGWGFLNQHDNYLANVQRWVRVKHLQVGLCGLDLRDGSWTPFNPDSPTYVLGSMIDFTRRGNASLYEMEGWSDPEDGGTWSLGDRSVLTLKFTRPPTTDLLLTIRAHAFVPVQRPHFNESMRLNGSDVAHWSITGQHPVVEEHVSIPRALFQSKDLRMEFFNDDPRSPMELGLSGDNRKLGLAFETVSVVPVDGSYGGPAPLTSN